MYVTWLILRVLKNLSQNQAADVASSGTLADGGESMHVLILVAREGEGLLCSEESDGFRRWHHYMQSRSPLQPGEATGRGSRVIAGGGGLGTGGRRRESRTGDGAIII